ncbi:hypothetical protein EDC04DRAFT_454890 [Pisolithus marmoratus]|nr:hypothetical protein EDC04DRAFT_454890 [Pisolithus marmoratus]
MAPGRVRKLLDSLPFTSATRFHRSHRTHSGVMGAVPATAEGTAPEVGNLAGGASDSVPVIAEAAEPRNVTTHVASLVPVTTGEAAAAEASSFKGEATGLSHVDTTRETTPSAAAFCMDPEKAREYMKGIRKFRVLVIGRANAGKTTILQRVCNTVDKPEIFDGNGNKIDNAVVQGTLGRGYHNIEDELVFRSNSGYLFHDSSGFEAGSAQQFDKMKKFVVDHAAARTLKKRIHAIW